VENVDAEKEAMENGFWGWKILGGEEREERRKEKKKRRFSQTHSRKSAITATAGTENLHKAASSSTVFWSAGRSC